MQVDVGCPIPQASDRHWTQPQLQRAPEGQLHLNRDPETHLLPRRTGLWCVSRLGLAVALRALPDQSTSRHNTIATVTGLSTKGEATSRFHHQTHHRSATWPALSRLSLPGLVWPPLLLHGIISLSKPTRAQRSGASRFPTSASHGVIALPFCRCRRRTCWVPG